MFEQAELQAPALDHNGHSAPRATTWQSMWQSPISVKQTTQEQEQQEQQAVLISEPCLICFFSIGLSICVRFRVGHRRTMQSYWSCVGGQSFIYLGQLLFRRKIGINLAVPRPVAHFSSLIAFLNVYLGVYACFCLLLVFCEQQR